MPTISKAPGEPRNAEGSKVRDSTTCCWISKSGRPPCRHWKGFRTNHPGIGACFLHGGNSPPHVISAEREMARRAVQTLGLPVDISPQEALLREVHRTAGHVEFLGQIVANMPQEELTWGQESKTEGIAHTGKRVLSEEFRARPSIWYRMYQEERRHLVEVCRTAIACGIAEREVRLREAQARLVARAMVGALRDLGHDPEATEVRLIIRRNLSLAAGELTAAELSAEELERG